MKLNINTSVTIRNNVGIKEIGSVLQNFTDQPLYVIGGELTSTLPGTGYYELEKFDECFHLRDIRNGTMVYCFDKKVANDLLDRKQPCVTVTNKLKTPKEFNNYADYYKNATKKSLDVSISPIKNIKRNFNLDSETNLEISFCPEGRLLGKISIKPSKNEFDVNIEKMITNIDTEKELEKAKDIVLELDENEKEMRGNFGKRYMNLKTPDILPTKPINNNEIKEMEETFGYVESEKVEEFELEESENSEEFEYTEETDIMVQSIMAQSRINETESLVSAILEARKRKRNPSDLKNVDEFFTSLLKKKLKTKKSIEIPSVILPSIPTQRIFLPKVTLGHLDEPLRNLVIETAIEIKNEDSTTGTFYYSGGTFSVLMDTKNIYSVYDWDNRLSLPRLDPEVFKCEYKNNPGYLPIAQFKIIDYKLGFYDLNDPYKKLTKSNTSRNEYEKINNKLFSVWESDIYFSVSTLYTDIVYDLYTDVSIFYPVDKGDSIDIFKLKTGTTSLFPIDDDKSDTIDKRIVSILSDANNIKDKGDGVVVIKKVMDEMENVCGIDNKLKCVYLLYDHVLPKSYDYFPSTDKKNERFLKTSISKLKEFNNNKSVCIKDLYNRRIEELENLVIAKVVQVVHVDQPNEMSWDRKQKMLYKIGQFSPESMAKVVQIITDHDPKNMEYVNVGEETDIDFQLLNELTLLKLEEFVQEKNFPVSVHFGNIVENTVVNMVSPVSPRYPILPTIISSVKKL